MGIKTAFPPTHLKYLQNGGEMGELIRTYNWAKTELGHPNTWSQGLLTTLSIMLGSKLPMFLWWGAGLTQFYNDAYRPSLGNDGKHPKALGQHGEDCWPEQELWPAIEATIADLRNGGESTWQEDILIPIYRNGHMEDVYWTLGYSLVIGGEEEIGGVLVTCFETTSKMIALERTKHTLSELAESEARLNNLITQAPVAIGVLKSRSLIVETANNKILEFWGKTAEIIGMPLASAMPELEGQPFLGILDDVFTSGKAYVDSEVSAMIENDGILSEYFFDFVYQPIQLEKGITDSIIVVATDLTDQVVARQAVEQGAQEFRQLADSIIQIVWITDGDGETQYFNKRWYDFTGTDFETSKDGKWEQQFHPDDMELALRKWDHSIKTGELYQVEYRLKNKGGEYVWVLGRAAPFYDAEGKISKWFGTCTDINDQKLLLEQKDDFISIASHELKTPLTSLKAYLQLINRKKDGTVSSSISGLMDRATTSAEKIYLLVDNLLDASKLNHGTFVTNKTLFFISDMIENSFSYLNLDNEYNIKTKGALDLQIFADVDRIQQIVTNFVSNAIKYAPDSKEITIDIERTDKFAKVSVTDYGAGIDQTKIPQLFNRYYRIDPTNIDKSGLGLGLYICSEIMKAHGGKIGAESKVGEGTTFWFMLPLMPD